MQGEGNNEKKEDETSVDDELDQIENFIHDLFTWFLSDNIGRALAVSILLTCISCDTKTN